MKFGMARSQNLNKNTYIYTHFADPGGRYKQYAIYPEIFLDVGAANLIYMIGEVFGVAAILTGFFVITDLEKDGG